MGFFALSSGASGLRTTICFPNFVGELLALLIFISVILNPFIACRICKCVLSHIPSIAILFFLGRKSVLEGSILQKIIFLVFPYGYFVIEDGIVRFDVATLLERHDSFVKVF